MRKYTSKGRVVYDRPTHYFERSDLIRICKNLNLQIFEITADNVSAFIEKVKSCAAENTTAGETVSEFQFGGGSSGGGGAGRYVGSRSAPLNGILYIEKK